MVSLRDISEYVAPNIIIPGASYLAGKINESRFEKIRPHYKFSQEKVIYSVREESWLVKLLKGGSMTIREIRDKGYLVSHMVFPIPESSYKIDPEKPMEKKRFDMQRHSRLITDKCVLFNLETGDWSYAGEHSYQHMEINTKNKLYECLADIVFQYVDDNINYDFREDISHAVVKIMTYNFGHKGSLIK
ncbi:MAG: hypothetical protein QXI33_03235 [Candidatus Pacearchaeota archaeon]